MANPVRQIAFQRYKNNRLSSWVLSFIYAFFMAAIVALDFLIPSLIIITVPLVILPFFFAATLANYSFRFDGELKLGQFFRFYSSYFRHPFNGSFRALVSFLKAFLFFAITLSVATFVYYVILIYTNPEMVETLVNTIDEILMNSESEINFLETILEGTDFETFYIYAFSSCFALASTYFTYRIGFESIGVYCRFAMVKTSPSFNKLVIKYTYDSYLHEMKRDFLRLNFPMYLLMLVGLGIGIFVGPILFEDVLYVIVFTLILELIMTFFFLPFYFYNNEALYEKYEGCFKKNAKEVAKAFVQRIQDSIQMSKEEENRLNESFNVISEEFGLDKDDEEKEKEENKKDPDGSN